MFRTITDRGPDGNRIEVIVFDPTAYPPKADNCPMIVCAACGVPNPAMVVSARGICLDCQCAERPADQDGFGASSFHTAMDRIRAQHLKLLQKLPREPGP